MIVYFTRHGESVNNVADRKLEVTPSNGDSLSERGWEQARGLGLRLQGEGIETIIASPYGRASPSIAVATTGRRRRGRRSNRSVPCGCSSGSG